MTNPPRTMTDTLASAGIAADASLYARAWVDMTPHLGVLASRVCDLWTDTPEGPAIVAVVLELEGERWCLPGVTLASIGVEPEHLASPIAVRPAVDLEHDTAKDCPTMTTQQQIGPTLAATAATLLATISLASLMLGGCARTPEVAHELAPEVATVELATAPAPATLEQPDKPPHVCTRWPAKCVTPSDPDGGVLELGLICCGDGWCLAIAVNADCGPAGSVYWCEHGQSIVNTQGLPDVECFDD